MKYLSIKQPYSSLIAEGDKKYEIRSWRTNYRGAIVICASQRPSVDDLPTGMAICVVDLIDVIEFKKSHARKAHVTWRPDHHSWVLSNPRLIESFKIKGQLGLFERSHRIKYI